MENRTTKTVELISPHELFADAEPYLDRDGKKIFFAFSSELKAKECLKQFTVDIHLSGYSELSSLKKASVTQYRGKTTTPYRFYLKSKQWKYLCLRYRAKAPVLRPKGDSCIKTLRGDTYCYFFRWGGEIVNPDHPNNTFPKRKGDQHTLTVTGSGLLSRKPSDIYPVKTPQYTKDQKAGFTNFQSTSLVTNDFYSLVFGHAASRSALLVGVLFEYKDVLLSDRLFRYDGGTINRNYDFKLKNANQAKKYANEKINSTLFSAKNYDKFKETIKKYDNSYNEVLARLRWSCDGSSKIFIASDNLESRLLAKQYADYLLVMLKNANKCSPDYQVPICFYTPDISGVRYREYSKAEQYLDTLKARAIFRNSALKMKKYTKTEYEFLFALTKSEIPTALNETIKDIPLAIDLLQNGYVHIFRFLAEKCNYDIEETLDKIKHRTDYQNVLIEILKHAVSGDNLSVVKAVLGRLENNKFYTLNYMLQNYLLYAIENNFVEVAEVMIQSGKFDLNERNIKGRSALHLAAKNNQISLIKNLLNHNVNVNSKDNKNRTPLHLAAKKGRDESINVLLGNNANMYAMSSSGKTPLHLADLNGRTQAVKTLTEHTEHKKNTNNTVLHNAIIDKKMAMIEKWLEDDSNIDLVNTVNRFSATPLHLASDYGDIAVVKLLLNKGAKIEATNHFNETPLHLAVRSGYIEVVKLLLDKGANIAAVDKLKETPLHLAVRSGNREVVGLLLAKGANIAAHTANGITPLRLASDSKILKQMENVIYCRLQEAASSKNTSKIIELLQCGGDIHHLRKCVLILCQHIKNDDIDMIENLVSVIKNIKNVPVNEIFTGELASQIAKNEKVVMALFNNNDILKNQNIDKNLLSETIICGNIELLKFLLNQKLNVIDKTYIKDSLLHVAARNNRLEAAQLLLKTGANIVKINMDDQTPVDVACGETKQFLESIIQATKITYESLELKNKPIAVVIANMFFRYAYPPLFSLVWRNHCELALEIEKHLLENRDLTLEQCKTYIHNKLQPIRNDNSIYNPYGSFAALIFEIEALNCDAKQGLFKNKLSF